MRFNFSVRALVAASAIFAVAAFAQSYPDKNVQYWQAFPPCSESDLSALHQQIVLKKNTLPFKPWCSSRPLQVVP